MTHAVADPLLKRVRAACARLAASGWDELFRHHGLDIRARDLAGALAKPLSRIDRTLDGFRDFAVEGCRGIEPGQPARSLLFHAFASPQVTSSADGSPLKDFPTPAEIEAVENYVYSADAPSLHDLRLRAGGAPVAVVVFAAEYRPAINTVHLKHADMCYSRVGVSRVGTEDAEYLPEARGYLPFVAADDRGIRVLPCRYAAYIAAYLPGDRDGFGPMRFKEAAELTREFAGVARTVRLKGDGERRFWVPLHKLFEGDRCLRGLDLRITWTAHHQNEKLRRAHVMWAAQGRDSGAGTRDLGQPPFVITEGLVALATDPAAGSTVLLPTPHPRLVAAARDSEGKAVTFNVPEDGKTYSSSVNIVARRSGARAAPEYVHGRHQVLADGEVKDLNKVPNVAETVGKGGYRALHYVDYTADGWVAADCPALSLEAPRSIPAYSLVAPPDFFPRVKQQQLMQWWKQSVPPDLEPSIWPGNPGPPEALCDVRSPGNVTLPDARFEESDDTAPAIVGHHGSGRGAPTRLDPAKNVRAATLTDGAAGVFAPGWDCSVDRTEETDPSDNGVVVLPGVTHLGAYGLGSPFPEDAKLCAALSAFWPAAAPDITRTFPPGRYATATPLPDDVIGQAGSPPWDGIPGPTVDERAFPHEVQYTKLEYGDYVETALNGGFLLGQIGRVTVEEYMARTVSMARVYAFLDAKTTPEKTEWGIYSFREALPTDPDLQAAQASTKLQVGPNHAYRFEVFKHRGMREHPDDFRKVLVRFDEMMLLFADARVVLRRKSDGTWEGKHF